MVRTREGRQKEPPVPLKGSYPSPFTQCGWKASNTIFNRLYPVKPWVYATTAVASFAYFSSAPKDWPALSSLPDDLRDSAQSWWPIASMAVLSLLVAYIPVFLLRCFLRYFLFRYKRFLFEDPKRPSLLTKFWGICYAALKRFAPPRLETCDAFLPSQPVPRLEDSLGRYLESVRNILDEEEYHRVKEMCDAFQREEGRWLQLYTKLYAIFTDNYVTSFWEKYAYLYGRQPLLINSSVAHVDLVHDIPANQAVRAAHVAHIETLNCLAIAKQAVRPLGSGLVYSGHYRKMYCTTRIPGESIDELKTHPLSKHIVVYRRDGLYRLEVFNESGRLYSIEELIEIFAELILRTDNASAHEAKLPSLTHDQRSVWAKNRQRFFLKHANNRRLLEVIESAMFVIILDDADDYGYDPKDPSVLDKFMKSMLTGSGCNRWADKSLNHIIAVNGRAGGTTEHSIGDGVEFDHLFENFVQTDLQFMQDHYPRNVQTVEELHAEPSPHRGKVKLAERLRFEIDDEMETEIDASHRRFQSLRNDLHLSSLIFTKFGKDVIKKGGCSPDAFVQMAIQLAFYKQQRRFVLTYEAASSRFFARSRTETLRTVSDESCAFVRSMIDEERSRDERVKLLRDACRAHSVRNKEIMAGKGFDRHLFVLYILSKAIPKLHSPFLEYYISQPWVLSTSQPPTVTNQIDEDSNGGEHAWLGASFGPVHRGGYGVCYRLAGSHSICIHVTSYKSVPDTDSNTLRSLLTESLEQMAELFHGNVE